MLLWLNQKGFPGGKECLPMQETLVWFLGWEESPSGENGNPFQYSCLENPVDRRAWHAAAHGLAKELDMTQRLNNNRAKQQGEWAASAQKTETPPGLPGRGF